MNFGDDYLYSFMWQGNTMFDPLSEDAKRVSSIKDLLVSQWSLYFTWGGRTIGQLLTQFFLWMGKGIFDVFNALIGVILVAEISWYINKGKINFNFESGMLCWISFLLWAFTPAFSSVFLWLTAACIYLWTHVILLAFLIPFVQKYYYSHKKMRSSLFRIVMLFGGIIAGWTNENSVCWVLFILLLFNYQSKKNGEYESWMGWGFFGLLLGYSFLMLAPGNIVRLHTTYGNNWFSLDILKENLNMLAIILTYQLFLWYFIIRSLFRFKFKHCEKNLEKDFWLVKILCATAFGTIVVMLFSPFFPARSGFFGTILLIISAGILLRIKDEFKIEIITNRVKNFFLCIGAIYFAMTVAVSLKGFYQINLHMHEIKDSAQYFRLEKNLKKILIVNNFNRSSKLEDMMSGFHIPNYELSEDESDWKNVAFARYYGIKGIRMVRNKNESEKERTKALSESNPTVPQSR